MRARVRERECVSVCPKFPATALLAAGAVRSFANCPKSDGVLVPMFARFHLFGSFYSVTFAESITVMFVHRLHINT